MTARVFPELRFVDLDGDLLDLAGAAVYVGCSYGAVWQWWHRGKLPQARDEVSRQSLFDPAGRPLFRPLDVRRAEARTRRERRGRPRKLAS